MALSEKFSTEDQKEFYVDVKKVKWKQYVEDIHIPGIEKFAMKVKNKK